MAVAAKVIPQIRVPFGRWWFFFSRTEIDWSWYADNIVKQTSVVSGNVARQQILSIV